MALVLKTIEVDGSGSKAKSCVAIEIEINKKSS